MGGSFSRWSCPCSTREKPVRVLVTGASGLLGRQIMSHLAGDTWEVRGLYGTRARENLVQCDLTERAQIDQHFADFKPDVVIHCAAERRPDVVFKQPDAARTLNIDVTCNIAEACHKHDVMMIFMSTDYIFDGEDPPYAVDARPRPLSTYGEQKFAGEQMCLEKCRTVVLRVPLLYGPMEYTKESGVTALYDELTKGMQRADNMQKRYPTYTCDVARILTKMLEVHFLDAGRKQLSGIYHWQANEPLTKYDMTMIIASIVDMDASGIEASLAKPKFPIPQDSQLDCSRLELELGIDAAAYRTSFKAACEESLMCFLEPNSRVRKYSDHNAESHSVGTDEEESLCRRRKAPKHFMNGANANGKQGEIDTAEIKETTSSQVKE